jgi:hypothetical protein
MPGQRGHVGDLGSWLRRNPQPVIVRAYTAEGVKTIRKPSGVRIWREWTDTILALDPSKVEALDKEGNVLRACVLNEDDQVLGPAGQATPDAGNKMQSTLVVLAQLLAESYTRAMNAYDRGAEMARAATEAQTAHQLEMMTLQMQRVTVLERFVTQSHMHAIAQIEEARELARERADVEAEGNGEGGGGLFEEMAAQFMPSLMAGQQAAAAMPKPAAAPTPNGAPKVPPKP